jgi:hypothetical protein
MTDTSIILDRFMFFGETRVSNVMSVDQRLFLIVGEVSSIFRGKVWKLNSILMCLELNQKLVKRSRTDRRGDEKHESRLSFWYGKTHNFNFDNFSKSTEIDSIKEELV